MAEASDELLIEEIETGIALVTLNRPDALNALTLGFVHEIDDALLRIGRDPAIRVVVLTGAGRAFCAGGDFEDVAIVGAGNSTVQEAMGRQDAAAGLVTRLVGLPQPVIAAVNGPAAGGGLALALASDLRICSSTAKFATAFARIGLASEMGVSYLLPRIAGPTLASEMVLTGRKVEAEEALRHRLVLEVTEPAALLDRAVALARDVVGNSPFGVSSAKRLLWANLQSANLQSAIDLESATQMLCARTEDQAEALAAFMERRAPAFENR